MPKNKDSTVTFGRLAPDWKKVYPEDEFHNVAHFVQSQWQKVADRRPPDFHLGRNESRLTKFFNGVLEQFKSEGGFIGHFVSEGVHGNPDMEQGILLDERRTDIRYLSARSDLTLTFEFKKLKDTRDSRVKYYGESGIERFVGGHYAKDNRVGVMVGLVGADADQAMNGIERALSVKAIQSQLHMLPCPKGYLVRNPSDLLPNIAKFDTEHSRAVYQGRPEIILCHMFFETPEPKRK